MDLKPSWHSSLVLEQFVQFDCEAKGEKNHCAVGLLCVSLGRRSAAVCRYPMPTKLIIINTTLAGPVPIVYMFRVTASYEKGSVVLPVLQRGH